MYLGYFTPYESQKMNLNEGFNELCVLLSGYTLIVFTDFERDLDVRHTFGYILIGVILMNFAVNIGMQVVQVFIKLCLKLRNS